MRLRNNTRLMTECGKVTLTHTISFHTKLPHTLYFHTKHTHILYNIHTYHTLSIKQTQRYTNIHTLSNTHTLYLTHDTHSHTNTHTPTHTPTHTHSSRRHGDEKDKN